MAQSRIELSPLALFDPVSDPTSLGPRWKAWKRRFETYIAALGVTDDTQKRALLLYQAGQATQDIFDTLTDTGEANNYKKAMEKLDAYFTPKKNVDYEIFKFRTAVQLPNETVDQFATRLRKLAQTCSFTDPDIEIKSAIIQHCTSKRLRRFAFIETDVSLANLLAKARALEASEIQATGIENTFASMGITEETTNKISVRRKPRSASQPNKQQNNPSTDPKSNTCGHCGRKWPHKNNQCPAKGKVCSKCGKANHFAAVCRSKPKQEVAPKTHQSVHTVSQANESSSEDEYLFTLKPNADTNKAPIANIKMNDIPVTMMVDTGASIDIIDESTYNRMQKVTKIPLHRSNTRVFAYGSPTQLPVVGKFQATLESSQKITVSEVHVVQGHYGCLLSYQSATTLGLIHVKVNRVEEQLKSSHEQLLAEFAHLFEGIGELKDFEVKLHIDQDVPPVAQPARRIPFHMRKKVSAALAQLEQQGIIEKVQGPTPFVSPLVVIPKKDGEVRLCVDMRMANKAIQRERHPTPTVDDLIHAMNGAKIFSKLDLRAGYHQLTLAEESRYITTFATHKGLRRYRKLNFGTSSASEIFQQAIHDQIRDIPNVINMSDDVIVYGKTQAEHDSTLRAVFQRFSERGLTLNKEKCKFNQDKLTFFGFVFSSAGISPDPVKVEAIHNAPPPTTAKDVRSFLGLATYCSKFIRNFSDLTQPLRDLTKKHATFRWTSQHAKSFQAVKSALESSTVMAYFDQNKETELVTDASPTGLSAILSQKSADQDDRRIVSYISRSLTDVEKKYSQTEREALAIVWAIERLNLYLYGARFTLMTDCKPVEMILNNPMSRPPARIERWNLRLQDYDFDIQYIKGLDNPSDFLSRHHPTSTNVHTDEFAAVSAKYLNFLVSHAVPKAMTLSQIQDATKSDKTLQHLTHVIQTNQWNFINKHDHDPEISKAEIQAFSKIRDELSIAEDSGIILRGSRIVLPNSLRQKAIEIAHEGHQGVVKTKRLLREKVWFPGIDNLVQQNIETCIPCQATGSKSKPEPLEMTDLPPEVWHTVNIDFCGPFPGGEYLLVVIDAYSRFPEVEIVSSTSSKVTIPKLERIFATHGLPQFVMSDNGPLFPGQEFHQFMKELGATHKPSSPLWPQGNAEVERFM